MLKKTYIALLIAFMAIFCFVSCSDSSSSYEIGDKGPAGGYVFYDKGSYSDGWRYLEAAPNDLVLIGSEPSVDSSASGYATGTSEILFGTYRTSADGSDLFVNGTTTYNASNCTGTAIGTGKTNTSLLVSAMGESGEKAYDYNGTSYIATPYYAANLCSKLSYGGYDDWFLPSYDELCQMYAQKSSIGGLEDSYYWSSSEDSTVYGSGDLCAFLIDLSDGEDMPSDRTNEHYIRPVRAF